MPHQVFNELKVSISSGQRKARKKICQLQYCSAAVRPGKFCCPKHTHQLRKVLDPVSYIFSARKQRAKERGHEWTITIENFRDWCAYTGYHLYTGRTCSSLTIERKDPLHGYHIWNITTLTLSQNSAKGTKPAGGYYFLDEAGVMHYRDYDGDVLPF